MPKLRFTKHFKENWIARVGNVPTRDTVAAIIRSSMRVQGYRNVIADGKPWRVLAIYWHPELDLIIKLDPMDNCAVTVMSRACWRYDGDSQATDKPAPVTGFDFAKACQESRDVIAIKRQKRRALTDRAYRIAEAFADNGRMAR